MVVREVLRRLGQRQGQLGFRVVDPAPGHRLGQLDERAVRGLHSGRTEISRRLVDHVRVGHQQAHLG
ncbi:hypothetical protein [Streptomyces sp. NBC_01518]|uniref:hypothetical protein n=1 Tax=Streptomyces sp. NBC_01518 TaxID=2903891 RepID=UPI003870DA3C